MPTKYPKTRKYKLTSFNIARWFGYSCANSYRGSSAHEDMANGIEKVIEHVEAKIRKDLDK